MAGTLEALHSVQLGHPNVVQTFKSTQRPIPVRVHAVTPAVDVIFVSL